MGGKSLNRVQLLGNVGKDPELKYTTGGTAVAKFSMATTSSYKGKDGEWQDKTEWHNIVCWARLAEIAGEYVKKGDKLYIEGRMETNSWEDKQSGVKKYMTSVVAGDMILLGDRKGGGAREDRGETRTRRQDGDSDQRRSGGRPVTEDDPIDSSDIPFNLLGRGSENAQLWLGGSKYLRLWTAQ